VAHTTARPSNMPPRSHLQISSPVTRPSDSPSQDSYGSGNGSPNYTNRSPTYLAPSPISSPRRGETAGLLSPSRTATPLGDSRRPTPVQTQSERSSPGQGQAQYNTQQQPQGGRQESQRGSPYQNPFASPRDWRSPRGGQDQSRSASNASTITAGGSDGWDRSRGRARATDDEVDGLGLGRIGGRDDVSVCLVVR